MARQGRYPQVRDDLRVKEVRLGQDPDRRWIVCHNPVEAGRDTAHRSGQLETITVELAGIATARATDTATAAPKGTSSGKRPAAPSDAVHREAECRCVSIPRWAAG